MGSLVRLRGIDELLFLVAMGLPARTWTVAAGRASSGRGVSVSGGRSPDVPQGTDELCSLGPKALRGMAIRPRGPPGCSLGSLLARRYRRTVANEKPVSSAYCLGVRQGPTCNAAWRVLAAARSASTVKPLRLSSPGIEHRHFQVKLASHGRK